jgi:hypothetical protein
MPLYVLKKLKQRKSKKEENGTLKLSGLTAPGNTEFK